MRFKIATEKFSSYFFHPKKLLIALKIISITKKDKFNDLAIEGKTPLNESCFSILKQDYIIVKKVKLIENAQCFLLI